MWHRKKGKGLLNSFAVNVRFTQKIQGPYKIPQKLVFFVDLGTKRTKVDCWPCIDTKIFSIFWASLFLKISNFVFDIYPKKTKWNQAGKFQKYKSSESFKKCIQKCWNSIFRQFLNHRSQTIFIDFTNGHIRNFHNFECVPALQKIFWIKSVISYMGLIFRR